MRFLALVNPVSGGRAGGRLLRQLCVLFPGKYPGSAVVEIDPANLKAQLQKAQGFDCLVVAGGDGSVSQIIQYADSSTPKIAIFPLGTGNDLARELGVYRLVGRLGLQGWLSWCESAAVRDLDVWKLCGGTEPSQEIRFCNYFSIGFDAAVVECFHRWRYRFPGIVRLGGAWANRLGYALSGLRCLANKGVVNPGLERDGESPVHLGDLRALLFANIRSCMGLGQSNMLSDSFDGRIEAVAVRSVINYCAMLTPWFSFPVPVFSGSAGSWRLTIVQPLAVQADGEPGGELGSGEYRIERCGSVPVLVGNR